MLVGDNRCSFDTKGSNKCQENVLSSCVTSPMLSSFMCPISPFSYGSHFLFYFGGHLRLVFLRPLFSLVLNYYQLHFVTLLYPLLLIALMCIYTVLCLLQHSTLGTSHSMDYDVHRMTSNWFSASSSCNIIWSRSYSTQTMWNRLDTANLWSHVDNTLKMWRNVMFSKEAGWEQTLRTLCQLYVVPTNSTKNIKFPQVKNSTPKIYILDYNFIGLQSFWTISHTSPMNQSIATM